MHRVYSRSRWFSCPVERVRTRRLGPCSTRVLHVSDLHFGRNDQPEPIEALARLIEEVQPGARDRISGDLTHRGLRSQHDRAAEFLRGLELPLLAVPGNHDIPYTLPEALHEPVGRVRAPLGDDPAGLPLRDRWSSPA